MARIATLAKRDGTTAHNFILAAIAEKTDQFERRADFDAVADARHAAMATSGKTIAWDDMRGYLEQRMSGVAVRRPAGRKLAK